MSVQPNLERLVPRRTTGGLRSRSRPLSPKTTKSAARQTSTLAAFFLVISLVTFTIQTELASHIQHDLGWDKAFEPEKKVDFTAEYQGVKGPVKWIEHHTEDEFGLVNLNKALDKHKVGPKEKQELVGILAPMKGDIVNK